MSLLSIYEVAEILGICPRTVREHISAGRLPAFKVGPGRTSPIRIKAEDVEALLRRIPTAGE